MALQSGASPIPAGDTMPIPVTTMRRASITLPSLEKIEDALLHQRARDQRPEELRLALRVRVVHQLEGRQGGRRLRARDRARELARLVDHAAGCDAAVDEPDAMGLRRADRLAAQDHLQGLRPSDEPYQPADASHPRDEAHRQ